MLELDRDEVALTGSLILIAWKSGVVQSRQMAYQLAQLQDKVDIWLKAHPLPKPPPAAAAPAAAPVAEGEKPSKRNLRRAP